MPVAVRIAGGWGGTVYDRGWGKGVWDVVCGVAAGVPEIRRWWFVVIRAGAVGGRRVGVISDEDGATAYDLVDGNVWRGHGAMG